MYNNFTEKWKTDLMDFPILRKYRLFKQNFIMEKYLLVVRDFKIRKCLTQLRLSSHKLRIETGRHCKPKLLEYDRICQYCGLNEIEDECHFLLQCPYYTEERIQLFVVILGEDPQTILENDCLSTFRNLLATDNETILFSLCKFLMKSLKKRNTDVR